MALDFAYWRLYADDIFLKITFSRDSKRMKLTEPGAYLFSFNLLSKEQKAKANFSGEDRERWKDLWVDKIKVMKRERYAKEQALVKRGFTIATAYADPRIHPADPVEP